LSETIWCEWEDINLPSQFTLLTDENDLMNPLKLDAITVYIPKYIGGVESLKVMQRMPNLKLVQLLTAGYEDALRYLPKNVSLANARGVHDLSTAELALGLTLASQLGIISYSQAQQSQTWNDDVRGSIINSKIAIVGFGSIGQEIAKTFAPFTSKITGFTRTGSNGSKRIDELDKNLGEFDIVILITPLTEETLGLFDARRIALMKPGALLVNMARGKVVVTQDLVSALNEGRIRAAVDVTDPEPLPAGHPLWSAKNLIISPHVGGNSTAFPSKAKLFISEQLENIATGSQLLNLVVSH
jgi:phosphoglycerate dehydrogenase-like enzyme